MDMGKNEVIYNGESVRISATDNPEEVRVRFTDSITAFNKIKKAVIVGKGRLMVCMADLQNCMDRIEAAGFYRSIVSYMDSPDFNPQMSLSAEDLQGLLSGRSSSDSMEDLKNISYKI